MVISSPQRTLSSVRGRFASSFMAIMATESVLRIEGRINQRGARISRSKHPDNEDNLLQLNWKLQRSLLIEPHWPKNRMPRCAGQAFPVPVPGEVFHRVASQFPF